LGDIELSNLGAYKFPKKFDLLKINSIHVCSDNAPIGWIYIFFTTTTDRIHYVCSFDPTIIKKETAKKKFSEFYTLNENCFNIQENEKISDLIKK
jgi:hypothetical protein